MDSETKMYLCFILAALGMIVIMIEHWSRAWAVSKGYPTDDKSYAKFFGYLIFILGMVDAVINAFISLIDLLWS